jgi:AraC-like DNA-binding protein
VDPIGELVLGVVSEGAMAASRARARYTFGAGDVCLWDASGRHAGVPHRGRHWDARVIVVEPAAIEAQLGEREMVPADVAFPRPLLRDPDLRARFVALHRALEMPAERLAQETLLVEYLAAVVTRYGDRLPPASTTPRSRARGDRGLARACAYLADHATRNVSLAGIAQAAGMSRFRLVRLFRAAFGAPPHRYQIGQRLLLARRMLEKGVCPSEVAAATGFADQSHMHRHFVRRLGITPGAYATACARRPARTFNTRLE